jgi:type 1 glutamine amidotransferase
MRTALTASLLLAGALTAVALAADAPAPRPIRALLVIGGSSHDYAHQKDILPRGIAARANVRCMVAYDPDTATTHLNPVYESADWARDFDVVVHDECSAGVKNLDVIDRILKPHRDGLPAVILHCGMHSYRSEGWPKAVTPWFEFTGLPSTGHGPQRPIAVSYVDPDSPITRGLDGWTTINEELYNNSAGKVLDTAHAVARGRQTAKGKDGKETTSDYVVAWANTYKGKTRVFGTTLGHNNDTVADGRYLDLVTRGLLWATGHLTDDGKPAPGYEARK